MPSSQTYPGRLPCRRLAAVRFGLPLSVAGALILAACASSSPSSAPPTRNSALLVTTPPARGELNTLVWDLPDGEPSSLDTVKSGDTNNNFVDSNLCDSLLRLNPDYTFSPSLATSWTYSPNYLTLTYTLRSGVKFWNGQPLTSADVAYSLLRNMNPANDPVNISFFTDVKSITTDGPYKVIVRFTQPDELFNHEMAGIAGQVSEKAYVQAKGSSYGTPMGGLMCSGPFRLVKWNPGSDIVLAANNHYWNKALRPRAKTVIIKFITDTATLVEALKSGAIDGTYEAPIAAIPALQSTSTGKLYFGKSSQSVILLANGPGPATDQKIRTALSMVINRTALAQQIYHGAAKPSYALMPSTWWEPPFSVYQAAYRAIASQPASAAAAKRLISGDPAASQQIVLAVPAGDQTLTDSETLIQEEGDSIGLHIKIETVAPLSFSNAFYDSAYRKGVSFLYDTTYTYVPDPLDNILDTVLPASLGGSLEYINFANQQQVANDLLQAESTFDATKRADLITQAQAIWEHDKLVIPLLSQDEVLFMNNKITGAPASYAYSMEPSLATVGLAG
jgi:peptide/nickel transport system substrate-binding protein